MEVNRGYSGVNDAAQNAQLATAELEGSVAEAAPPGEPAADAPPTPRNDSLRYAAVNGLPPEAQQAPSPAAAAANAQAAAQRLGASFTRVSELGQRIVDNKQPPSDED